MTPTSLIKRTLCGFLPITLFCLLAAGCKSTAPATTAPGAGTDPAAANQAAPANQPPASQPAQYPQAATAQSPAPAPQQYPAQQPSQYPQNSASTSSMPPVAPAPRRALVIPAGTTLRVRLDQTLSASHNQAGDTFSATVESPVILGGETIVKRGSSATGTVVEAKGRGHIKGAAYITIRLNQVRGEGRSYSISTTSVSRAQKGKGRRSAEFAGGGAGIGALIGGLAGGGKGAAIGAIAGGGAGTASGAMTGNADLIFPAETMLSFRLTRDAQVE